VLLAIAKVETDWGQTRNGQPDDLVPADSPVDIDAAALQAGGATATMLGLEDSRRIGLGLSWRRRWGEGGQRAYRQQVTVAGLMGRG